MRVQLVEKRTNNESAMSFPAHGAASCAFGTRPRVGRATLSPGIFETPVVFGNMPYVAVAIVSWISHDQPGFVAAELMDAYGTVHTFHDKLPVFGSDPMDENTLLPIHGMLGCEVKERFYEGSRYLARIDTERPWDIPSTNGEYHFLVPANAVKEHR